MSEILPNIHRIEAPLGRRLMAMHVLVGDRIYLVDTGTYETPEDVLFPHIGLIDRSITEVAAAVVTHADADHFGGNAALKRSCPQALIMAHHDDAALMESPTKCLQHRYDFMDPYGVTIPAEVRERIQVSMGAPTSVDVRLSQDEEIQLTTDRTLEILHLPGHSKGHLIVYDRDYDTAIITDAVLGNYVPAADGAPLFAPTYRHLVHYRNSIRRLRELNLKRMLPTHFPVIEGRGAVREFLDQSEQFTYDLEQRVLAFLRESSVPCDLRAIVHAIKPNVAKWSDPDDPFVAYSLCYPVAATLDAAVSENDLRVSVVDGVNCYQPS